MMRRKKQNNNGGHSCSTCGSSFIRREHLTRHMRSHTREKPFKCPICVKVFSRNDVLNRHIASHEAETADSTVATSTRACDHCAADRVRCSKEDPCKRCQQRQLKCSYPTADRRVIARAHENDANGLSSGSIEETTRPTNGLDSAHQLPSGRESGVNVETGDIDDVPVPMADVSTQASLLEHTSTMNGNYQRTLELGFYASNRASETAFQPEGRMQSYYNERALEVMSTNWISSAQYGTSDFGNQWPHLEFADTDVNMEFPLLFNMMQPPVETTFADQMVDHVASVPSGGYIPAQESSLEHMQSAAVTSERPAESPSVASRDTVRSTSSQASNTYYVDGTGARAPFNRTISHGRLGSAVSGGIPLSVSSLGLPNRELINLDNDLYGEHEPIQISDEYYDFLVQTAAEECRRHSMHVGWSVFPTLAQFRELVRLYAEKFHPIFPFLADLNFTSKGDDGWVLLLAIGAFAATHTPALVGNPVSGLLSDLLRSVLSSRNEDISAVEVSRPWVPYMAEGPTPENGPGLHVLQAEILQLMCMLRTGDCTSMRRALLARCFLVETCKRQELISRPGSPWDYNNQPDMSYKVRHRDAEIRAGMMIWLLDTMLSQQLACEPLLQIEDLQASLPIHDAPLVKMKGQCLPRNESEESVTVMDALELLHIQKTLPRVSEFGMKVIIYAICRNMKNLSVRTRIQLHSWTPTAQIQTRTEHPIATETWPPATELLSNWRNSACDCLDILHWRANSKIAAAAGWEHSTVYHLHFARLILLAPLRQIHTIAASWGKTSDQTGSLDNKKLLAARNHVLQWAIRDQHKARLAVVHSGALLWHIRRFSNYSFTEPFGIYNATLVIWAYSQCVNLKENGLAFRLHDGVEGNEISMAGDSVNKVPTLPAIASGMPASGTQPQGQEKDSSIIQIDRPCDDEIVQAFVRLDVPMPAYMQGVGNIHERSALRKILNEGSKLLRRVHESDLDLSLFSTSEAAGQAAGQAAVPLESRRVGLEQSYVRVLEDMMRRP